MATAGVGGLGLQYGWGQGAGGGRNFREGTSHPGPCLPLSIRPSSCELTTEEDTGPTPGPGLGRRWQGRSPELKASLGRLA